MDLKTIIWNECVERERSNPTNFINPNLAVIEKAYDLLDKVMRWCMQNGWVINQLGPFYHPHDDRAATDAELYELFKSQSE